MNQLIDTNKITLFLSVMALMLTLEFIAVLIDFISGTSTARAIGEKLHSKGLRRSFTKLGDYWRVSSMGILLDIILFILPVCNLPYVSMLIAASILIIEGKSVIENAKAKKSQAAKIPEIAREILDCKKMEEATNIINKIKA